MDRRRFLLTSLAGALAAPLAVAAQQGSKTARVGVLVPGPPDPQAADTYNAFRQALRERGWIEGQNLVLDFRYAHNQYERLPVLARELVALKPDAIFAVAAPAIHAAIQATTTIPIVIETLGDALSAEFMPDLARPGGNVTGVSGFAPELIAKRLQIIRDILPKADSVGVIVNLANPTSPPVVRATEAAGRQLKVQLRVVDVREAKELAGAFDTVVRHGADALVVVSDPLLHAERGRIVELAARHRLPTVYEQRLFTDVGGLLSYGPGRLDRFQRAAVYVDRVLRGAKPGDLPVERPTKFELAINMKTAKALGLTIPPSLLVAGGPGDRVTGRLPSPGLNAVTMLTRRRLLAGTLVMVAARGPAHAQRARVARVGVLAASPPLPDLASTNAKEALEQGLRELGWTPGVDIVLEYRYASGSVDRMREHVAELVRLPVDVIVARGTEATRLARDGARATDIPIVMSFVADPVAAGFVRSLARPGGKITGLSFLVQALQGKQLEYLKEVHPRLARVAAFGNPGSMTSEQYQAFVKALSTAAEALKLHHEVLEVRTVEEVRSAFARIAAARVDGLLLFTDPFLMEPNRAEVVALAAKHRLPAVYPWRNYVEVGGLMSYSASQYDLHRRGAGFVDKILKGTKPADLPVEQPTKFELVINVKTAKALGLTIPPSLLFRADQVIE